MSNVERSAQLLLFAAIEGGGAFWSQEISHHGAVETLAKIRAGSYLPNQPGQEKIAQRLTKLDHNRLQEEIEQCGAFLLTPSDMDWPPQLGDLAAPPIALIGKGERRALGCLHSSLSIVGTRNPTDYGLRIAGDFAFALAERNWVIVSGGAYGIDSSAHNGALLAAGETIAVLAGGFRHKYPAGNENLFTEISRKGLLLSEVMPSVRAEPFRFLTRNRIIAALTRGTMVIEAAYRSGSLRTAREAAELFRHVMAIPGSINSPLSEGCHRLIAERSAELVTSVADVMELVNPIGSE